MAVKRCKALFLSPTCLIKGQTKMAKRRYPFTQSQYYALHNAMRGLAMRMLKVKRLELSSDDLLDLTVPRFNHEVLKRAHEVCASYSTGYAYDVNYITSEGNVVLGCLPISKSGTAYYAPQNPMYIPHANHEAHRKLEEYVIYNLQVMKEFTYARIALETITEQCRSLREARFMWPTVRQLADFAMKNNINEDSVKTLINKLGLHENNLPPKFSPTFTKAQKEIFRHGSTAVSSALMLSDDLDDIEDYTSIDGTVLITVKSTPPIVVSGIQYLRHSPAIHLSPPVQYDLPDD